MGPSLRVVLGAWRSRGGVCRTVPFATVSEVKMREDAMARNQDHYDKLSEKVKAEQPLGRVWAGLRITAMLC